MNRNRSALTLIELLVVIAILALLATLVVPSFRGMTRGGYNVKCANNLKRIGQAVEGRLADLNASKLEPYGWPTVLVRYLGKEGSEVLACPEADGIPEAGGVHKPLSEFASIAYPPNYTGRVVEFEESGIMSKASQTQYDKRGGDGNGRVMRDHWASGEGYKDDGSGVIYWGYEDQGAGGDDYQDVFIKETLTPDGRSKLVCQSETSGKPGVWDKQNQVVLADYRAINRWYAVPRYSPTSATVYVETGSGTGSNYAMNTHTVGENHPGKIMAMDYIWVLARSTDDWDGNKAFDADGDGELDFARHRGSLNVLFPGGSVSHMDPYEIDPSNNTNLTGYWLP